MCFFPAASSAARGYIESLGRLGHNCKNSGQGGTEDIGQFLLCFFTYACWGVGGGGGAWMLGSFSSIVVHSSVCSSIHSFSHSSVRAFGVCVVLNIFHLFIR